MHQYFLILIKLEKLKKKYLRLDSLIPLHLDNDVDVPIWHKRLLLMNKIVQKLINHDNTKWQYLSAFKTP